MSRFIFSTKGLYGKKVVVFWIVFAVIMAPIIAIKYSGLTILLLLFGFLLGIPVVINVRIQQSFIDLYDDHIEGKAIPKNRLFGQHESFRLNYNEIGHISYKTNIVTISFNGGTYEIQAKGVEQKVIEIIKQQKILNN